MTEIEFENNDFSSVMLNRHSVRHFDKSCKIDRSVLTEMVKEATTAPSSCNLQAWHFVVVDTDEGKEKLRKIFMPFNHPQLDTCSAMVVLFGDTDAFKKYRDLWQGMYEEKKITKERLETILGTFLPIYEKADRTLLTADAMVDASLAAMQFMLDARARGFATNPIAGYDATKMALAMGLDPVRYVPVMAIAIGKPNESKQELVSTRYDVKDVLEFR